MELENAVAIVTGAGNGLGLGISKKLFAEGARLALWDMNFESVQKLASELDPAGERVIPLQVDITDETLVARGVEETAKKFERIDILVNNAGISRHKLIEETTREIWDSVINVNLTGTFLCCRAVVPSMKRQKWGKIINIASLGGRTGRPGVGVNYAASKAGVIGLTKVLARELGPSNIYVNAICPGPILTDQTKQYSRDVFETWNAGRAIPKDGLPEDIGDVVIFLASKRSNWVTGVSLDVNGGIFIG